MQKGIKGYNKFWGLCGQGKGRSQGSFVMRQERLVVKVSKERIRDKHVPEKLPQLVSGINTLLLDGLQNGGQLFSVTILLTVNAGVFQMGKLDEPFPVLFDTPHG